MSPLPPVKVRDMTPTLAQKQVCSTTRPTSTGGIWQAGNGPAADSNGFVYLITGNGDFGAANNNYGDSYLKFSQTTNGLTLADYFTPYNQDALNNGDIDVGSAGLLILPDSAGSAAHPHLLLGGSKANNIFLLDRDNLGQFNSTSDSQIVQEPNNAVGGMWCSPAYFNGMFYIVGQSDSLKSFTISNGQMGTTPTAHSAIAFGSSTPCISANGTNNAIVWAVEAYSSIGGGAAVLHAFNATNVAQELYNSGQNLARDNPGGAIEYTVPTVANGKVYVGAQYALSVFGIGNFIAAPTISPSGGIYTNSITVTRLNSLPGDDLLHPGWHDAHGQFHPLYRSFCHYQHGRDPGDCGQTRRGQQRRHHRGIFQQRLSRQRHRPPGRLLRQSGQNLQQSPHFAAH